jgi:hypothetical protein
MNANEPASTYERRRVPECDRRPLEETDRSLSTVLIYPYAILAPVSLP